jgi:DNA primase
MPLPSPLEAARGTVPEFATPPPSAWQEHGAEWVSRCQAHLWQREGSRALAYLHGRGLADHTIRTYGLGYQPRDVREGRAQWGLSPGPEGKPVWLPRGIAIPWQIDGRLWRINVRRPVTAKEISAGEPKYIGPPGFANALYNADSVAEGKPVLLVEGEIDAMTAIQEAPDLVAAAATGSTGGGRREPWIGRLAAAPCVLLAFDCDRNGAGDGAAAWWLKVLPNAVRWRPLLHDVNAMHVRGVSVRKWAAAGIEYALHIINTRR